MFHPLLQFLCLLGNGMAPTSKVRVQLFVCCLVLFVLAQGYILRRLSVEPKALTTSSSHDDVIPHLRGGLAAVTSPVSELNDEAIENQARDATARPSEGPWHVGVPSISQAATSSPLLNEHDQVETTPTTPTSSQTSSPTSRNPTAAVGAFVPHPDVGVDDVQRSRMLAIRSAMQHAWSGYETHAFGADEVGPVSGDRKQDVWGGLGVTLVDALDTLYIMGMARARDWVEMELDFTHLGKDGDNISVFEITIRELGGLLSAYDLSGDDAFRARAVELGDLLLPAFANGIFYTQFNVFKQTKTMNGWTGYRGLLADLGTLQLELRRLSDVTGNPIYAERGDAFYDIVQREGSYEHTGLFPVHFEVESGTFSMTNSLITIGALGDSFYEYLLKVWLYSGQRQSDAFLRDLYNDAVQGIETSLLRYSKPDDAYYLQEVTIPGFSGQPKQDHLLCFVPGMLALGTLTDTDPARVVKHLDMAKKLMKTCYNLYSRQPTGLAPDIVMFPGFAVADSRYRLRPETVESLMYLYRVTKDPMYQDWGWQIFKAIEKHAKTSFGYGAVLNVDSAAASHVEDKMESFFLAETLKYHYLLQSAPSFVPLDKFVFNTEAHPFRTLASCYPVDWVDLTGITGLTVNSKAQRRAVELSMQFPNRLKIPLVLVLVALFVGLQIYIVSRLDISPTADPSFDAFSRPRRWKPSPSPIVVTEKSAAANFAPRQKFIPLPHEGVDETQIARQDAIRRAMQHAWSGYETRAFGADEVAPVSGERRQNVWGGIGVTLVDSLDTLYIMGMHDEFQRARDWVANELEFSHLGRDGDTISVFEVIIRELGGLLSAYDLSQDNLFKAKAVELADLLLPAYEDQVFYTKLNVFTKRKSMNHWTHYRAFLADVGTLQLEMRYLSDITGNSEYAEKGDAFYDVIQREGSYEHTGLFPVHFEPDSGTFSRSDTFVTIGALGDSFYEYLLKVWLYSGKRADDLFLRQLYDDAVAGMEKHLYVHSVPDDAYFLQELRIPQMEGTPQQDHLLCFVPGMLALGSVGETNATKAAVHLDMATKLMHTCVSYYTRQPTGLAPDLMHFPGFDVLSSIYKLRPETVESLMYMYRVTHDPIYREWGWAMFEAIEQHAKTTFGYGAVRNVHNLTDAFVEDKMESFFLAETLKY
ncbi:hypothetical protein DYB38_010987, partial [Aphanomyces astaci]